MTPEVRQAVIDKHAAHKTPDYQDKLHALNQKIKTAKDNHKTKVEALFTSEDIKEAWKGMKELTGMNKRKKDPSILNEPGSAQCLNKFYARFDCVDCSVELDAIRSNLVTVVNNQNFTLPDNIVRKALCKIKSKKASGPDGMSAKMLKLCRNSLEPVITKIFELSFSTCTFPATWKIGEIVPIAKKDFPVVDNDLRPVTLTSVLSKCLERIGLWLLMPFADKKLDALQFAYVNNKSTDDAVCHLVHRIAKHLDKNSSHTVRALYLDYSSAFNTIKPHLLVSKLHNLGVPSYLQLWVLDFLTARPQYVRTSQEKSDFIVLNSGAPQGCVLSPSLFVLYTNDLAHDSDKVFIQKYADDTVVVGLCDGEKDTEYLKCVNDVNDWCKTNYLKLNVQKTKELIWDFRKSKQDREPVRINDMNVEVVPTYKYLGVIMDNKLSFAQHAEGQLVKVQKRLYCVRSMFKLHIDYTLIRLFYEATIPPLLLYACVAFYGLLTKKIKTDLEKPKCITERLL